MKDLKKRIENEAGVEISISRKKGFTVATAKREGKLVGNGGTLGRGKEFDAVALEDLAINLGVAEKLGIEL